MNGTVNITFENGARKQLPTGTKVGSLLKEYAQPSEIPYVAAMVNNDVSSFSYPCLLYTSPSPRDRQKSRMPSSA